MPTSYGVGLNFLIFMRRLVGFEAIVWRVIQYHGLPEQLFFQKIFVRKLQTDDLYAEYHQNSFYCLEYNLTLIVESLQMFF